jgi:hypothetical protein
MNRIACVAALLILCAPAMASITVEEAFAIAQQHSNVALTERPIYETIEPNPETVGFATPVGQLPGQLHRVSLESGEYLGYRETLARDPKRSAVTPDEALSRAQEVAAQKLPELAPTMYWKTDDREESSITVTGTVTPTEGAPKGPATYCYVVFERDSGRMSYYQYLHDPLPVAHPTIPSEKAVELARKATGDPTAQLLEEPYLWQDTDGLNWHTGFCTVDCDQVRVHVNAATGEATVASYAEGGGDEDRVAPSAPARSPLPWPYLAGAGVLALLAGVVVVARRRHK